MSEPRIRTVNGRTYTRRFAWLPIRSEHDELLWFCHYYITPGRNGVGRILSHSDYIMEFIYTGYK